MREIVLASASPRRCELLKQIGLSFTVMPANINEDISCGQEPTAMVEKLSRDKAFHVANELQHDCIVIGADTIVVKDEILGKPTDELDARNMLERLQGDWHEVITGITVVAVPEKTSTTTFERTRVKMKPLDASEIETYIATGEPMDKAGAYGIQGMGALLVDRIEGCYFNVVGLPLVRLSEILKDYGCRLL